jgi:tetratricopeptide (TPR) repeat protein
LLEGRLFWLRRTFEDFDRADAAFGSALKLDPEFAQAQAGLADVAVMRATYRMLDGETDVADDIARARVAAQRALTLDGSLVEPHAALAYALMLEGKFAASEVEYQKALTLNPNYSTAYVWRGVLKFCEGRLDAAIDEFRKAVDLDPLWPINLHMLSEALTHAGRFGEALAVNARGSAIRAVDWPPERGVLAMAAWRHGRRDDALSAARLVRQLWPQPPRWFADVDAIWILGQAGLRDEANAHAMQLLKELPAANSHRGLVLAALGRFDEALPHLERSGVMTRRNLFWDPVFDRFRDDPRFPQLMVKLGCAVEYKTARETLQRMQAKP